ncbi:uncharacterized protein LOC126985720 isoform X2 [Eriocheir sinensis]|uniref:uncharacterized protein LOC126985720 isoform X2 n=1 Tax=Eriocheir sinensis TaxID=95602 RepID=UPI0021CAD601|nr:uncharacterized protein LOC126985720 isoform X2 [Eriocheir sinensis]
MPGAAKKRGRGAALRLVLEPPAVPVRRRRPGRQHPRLSADANNRVQGRVNGRACLVQLDSGAEVTVVFWSAALRLGLVRGGERAVRQEVVLWTGRQALRVVQLDSVTIELGGGVQVVTPATVFPAWLEHQYDAQAVVLDAHQLRRGAMVQLFRPGGSDLLVRRPRRLQGRVRKTRRSVQPDVLTVRVARDGGAAGAPMTMLLDTGATGVHVSCERRALLLSGRPPPRGLELDLGGGLCLHAGPLGVVPSNDHDFILGVAVLCANGAVLDHGRHTLDLRAGAGWWRVFTQPPPRAPRRLY